MSKIFSRPYRFLQDHMAVYQFMLEIYERDWRNGVPAPFLEYALSSTWMDKSYLYRNRLWFDGDTMVGVVFYENPSTDVFFSLRPGYEILAEELSRRDMNYPEVTPDNYAEIVERMNRYMDEFELSGVDHLVLEDQ